MTAQPKQSVFARDHQSHQQDRRSLLRFIACGSVDHGKSTLIGRLLYEANFLFDDQLATLKGDSRRHGTHGDDLDFSLILDGLAAEREQKITIDVAYRFFATARRKFIVADAPGHEQYTRNMATGASTADLALILINAATGLTSQTKRHSRIVAMLGVRSFVVAVNKMDLADWALSRFKAVEAEFRTFADDLDLEQIVFIPMSARSGDNIVARSQNMNWYRGPTLIEHLERVEIATRADNQPFRLPIQLVNRPNPDFRGFSGSVASGEVTTGMPVQVWPSGQASRIARIIGPRGEIASATAGQSLTVTLEDDIDVSRGDVITAAGHRPIVADRLYARVFWMGTAALVPGRSYLLRLGTSSAKATAEPAPQILDLDSRTSTVADEIRTNEIGQCVLRLDRLIAVARYAENKDLGSFILVDPETHDTVAMGCIEQAGSEDGRLGRMRRTLIGRWRRLNASRLALASASDSRTRSVAKTLSWRAAGSIDTFVVTFVITGSTVFAGSVALTEVVTKVVFYYFHERIWSFVSWGRR
jgi:sulfate adenylyltransferase large subunit